MSEKKPGNPPGDAAESAAKQPENAALFSTPSPSSGAESGGEKHGLSSQPDRPKTMSGAAERIGSVLGSAQRQVRHGLELVSPVARPGASAERAETQAASDQPGDAAARMMQAIEDGVADIRRGIAGRLIPFQSGAEPVRYVGCRLRNALAQIGHRARRFAAKNPVQAVAVILGLGFAVGAALRLGSLKRR
jgi:hypothetical protein